MRRFKFIEHTADIAVIAEGDSLEELFTASAEALVKSIAGKFISSEPILHDFMLTAETKEELLVEFLNELNYLTEVKKLIFSEAERVAISEKDNIFELNAKVKLKKLNPDYTLENEIKAITYHQMKIEFKVGMYSTRIVFDI
jgi:SHS2 domain-containing protein